MTKLTEPQKLWLADLRSGKYEQATEALQKGDGFCCLGLACMTAKEHGDLSIKKDASGMLDGVELSEYTDVMEWLGLHDEQGSLTSFILMDGNNEASSLIHMNDDLGMSFTEIADAIEEDPANFFIQSGE